MLTSLLLAPPPSDGAELIADPGRLPDSEPEILMILRHHRILFNVHVPVTVVDGVGLIGGAPGGRHWA